VSAPHRVPRPHCTWVTDVTTGTEHAVTDAAYDAAMAAPSSLTYPALCDYAVLPAPMAQPPAGQCGVCARFAAARLTSRSESERGLDPTPQAPRLADWWRRLTHHPRHVA
jgi:hypothetical protein